MVVFSAALALGWPHCCGETMRLETTFADVGKAVNNLLGNLANRTISPEWVCEVLTAAMRR
jgi:hypothetical protein